MPLPRNCLCKAGFVGNEICMATTGKGTMAVTIAVTPGSCDNNVCGLQRKSGDCFNGRCTCPDNSQMASLFARNPNDTARAHVPVVPACRYPFFTATGAFFLTSMSAKPGGIVDITFTLAQPGVASTCAGPDAALLPRVMLINTTCGKRAVASMSSAPQQITMVSAKCKDGENSAKVEVPNGTSGACMKLVIKLADGSAKRVAIHVF